MKIMSAALDRDLNSDDWRRGFAIPYACRWLSRRRWEDEHRAAIPASEPEQVERRLVGERC